MATEPVRVEDARLGEMARSWLACFQSPRRPPLSAWSAEHCRLPDGSRYRPFPYQIEILDSLSDPRVRQVSVMKSARVGWSKIIQNYIGYVIDQAPRHVLVYQPTIGDAEDYSKTDLAEALSIPALGRHFSRTRDGANSIRLKIFPGGTIRINGANSPAHFRRVHADSVILEEPDGYPPTAGIEGDQVELAYKRTEASTAPLKVAGSTPTIKGASKIGALMPDSTQERRWWPCPQCGEWFLPRFGDGTADGLRWEPKDRPQRVWYQAPCGCVIGEEHKVEMDAAGEWRAEAPENWPHRGFYINSLYSQLPGAAWLEIARSFVRSKDDPQKLKVFVNQTLGEEFEVRGEAPPWRSLYDRREHWGPAGTVPRGALVLTAAADVQKDRLEFAVWGWGRDRQSWLVDHVVIGGSPYTPEPWRRLREEIERPRAYASGIAMRLAKVGIDAGYATTAVADFVRSMPRSLVIPVRGHRDPIAPPIASPRAYDLPPQSGGKRATLRVHMVGDHLVKSELYGLLSLAPPLDGEAHPPGFVHLPDWADDELCRQLVAEEWEQEQGVWVKRHANEQLDLWKYARAVAILSGVDRMTAADWDALAEALGDRQGALFEAMPLAAPPPRGAGTEDGGDDADAEEPAERPVSANRPMPVERPKIKPYRSRWIHG